MQAVPKRECAAKTMRSAVTPAPEEGSNPAMVRTVCMGGEVEVKRKFFQFEKKVSFLFSSRCQSASYLF
jgi:hypothetical protein